MSHEPVTAGVNEGMRSHRGRVRRLNEDSYGSFRTVLRDAGTHPEADLLRRKGLLYVVADGMGGHDRGDLASAIAVQRICTAYYADSDDEPRGALSRALNAANAAIYAAGRADPS